MERPKSQRRPIFLLIALFYNLFGSFLGGLTNEVLLYTHNCDLLTSAYIEVKATLLPDGFIGNLI